MTAFTMIPASLAPAAACQPSRRCLAFSPPQPLPLALRCCQRPSPVSAARPVRGSTVQAQAEPAATPQQRDAASLDVSGAVVSPAYRSTPWAAEAAAAAAGGQRAPARIAFVSESGICRAVLAAAAFQQLMEQAGLAGQVECECRATRDFCVGEGPDPTAALVAAELDLQLPPSYQVQQFEEARDIVDFDLVLVMDKFTAADVLREVSVFDTISTWGKANYSSKVRRLGEFDPKAAAAGSGPGADPEAADIGDPLYGNVGGEAELQAVRKAAAGIQQACHGLADFLVKVEQRHRQEQGQGQGQQQGAEGTAAGTAAAAAAGGEGSEEGRRLGDTLTAAVREMGAMDWLVPPMLQAR